MTVATISFEGPTLNWYRSQEEREKFTDWTNLKESISSILIDEGGLIVCSILANTTDDGREGVSKFV